MKLSHPDRVTDSSDFDYRDLPGVELDLETPQHILDARRAKARDAMEVERERVFYEKAFAPLKFEARLSGEGQTPTAQLGQWVPVSCPCGAKLVATEADTADEGLFRCVNCQQIVAKIVTRSGQLKAIVTQEAPHAFVNARKRWLHGLPPLTYNKDTTWDP